MIVPRSIVQEGFVDVGKDDYKDDPYFEKTQETQLKVIKDQWKDGYKVRVQKWAVQWWVIWEGWGLCNVHGSGLWRCSPRARHRFELTTSRYTRGARKPTTSIITRSVCASFQLWVEMLGRKRSWCRARECSFTMKYRRPRRGWTITKQTASAVAKVNEWLSSVLRQTDRDCIGLEHLCLFFLDAIPLWRVCHLFDRSVAATYSRGVKSNLIQTIFECFEYSPPGTTLLHCRKDEPRCQGCRWIIASL